MQLFNIASRRPIPSELDSTTCRSGAEW